MAAMMLSLQSPVLHVIEKNRLCATAKHPHMIPLIMRDAPVLLKVTTRIPLFGMIKRSPLIMQATTDLPTPPAAPANDSKKPTVWERISNFLKNCSISAVLAFIALEILSSIITKDINELYPHLTILKPLLSSNGNKKEFFKGATIVWTPKDPSDFHV